MLTVDDARRQILERVQPLDALELPIAEAHGCVLAEAVSAPEDLPPFPSSAVDGFALRSSDTANAAQSPVSLAVIGDAAPGKPFAGRLAFGECVRIGAGAVLPEGADSVVPTRDVAVVGSSMAIGQALQPNGNVRPAGEDVRRGEGVMAEGQRLRGMDVGVLAALGRGRVQVRPRPRAVVFSIGGELREPGQPLGPGEIRDANGPTIYGMAREAGAEPSRGGVVPVERAALKERVASYLPQADVFISSGGIDEVQTFEDLGDVRVSSVGFSPGGAVAFGTIEGRPFFGLPEDPVAVAVAFEVFVRPALLRMAGRQTVDRPSVEARMVDEYRGDPASQVYLRVRAWRDETGWQAKLSGRQGPTIVSSVARSNALAVVPAGAAGYGPGDPVRLMLLEPLEGW